MANDYDMMNEYSDKSNKDKSNVVANTVTRNSGLKSTVEFIDNRPEAIIQGKFRQLANSQLKAIQLKFDQIPEIIQSKEVLQMKRSVPANDEVAQENVAYGNDTGIVQRILSVKTGSAGGQAVTDFVKLVNAIFGGHFTIAYNGRTFELSSGKSKAPFPIEAKVLYDVLEKIINNEKITSIDFTSKNKGVFIGQFETSQIDVSDAEKFGINVGFEQGPTAASMLVHELEEQFHGQVNNVPMGDDYIGTGKQKDDEKGDAHWDFAIPMEEQAIGGYREGTSPKEYMDDTKNYTQLIKYSYKSGRVVIVMYTVVDGNVESVERKIYSSEEAWETSEQWKQYNYQMDQEEVTTQKKEDIESEKVALEKELEQLGIKEGKTYLKKKLKILDKRKQEIKFRLSAIKQELLQVEAKLKRMKEEDGVTVTDDEEDVSGSELEGWENEQGSYSE